MIRFRLQELLAEKQFRDGRKITLTELSQSTGINRVTLSKMVNQRGYSTVTDNLDSLCRFFGCNLGDLAVYIPEGEVPVSAPVSEPNETGKSE
jgi:putative transcriptional regulator